MNPLTKSAPTTPPATPVAEIVGSEEAFKQLLPIARGIDPREVVQFRADGSLAYHNVAAGVASVTEKKKQVLSELPAVKFDDLSTMPDLALAVMFAASQVNRVSFSTHDTAKKLAEARNLRVLMLTSAESLAIAGLVDKRAVEKIRQGRGDIDSATDCVDLAALFAKLEPGIRGKSPVTNAQVARASELGTELLSILKPKAAHKGKAKSPELEAAVDARNRLWTLLVQRHDLLRRVACWLWGEHGMDKQVPPLQSRAVPEKREKGAKVRKTDAVADPKPSAGAQDTTGKK